MSFSLRRFVSLSATVFIVSLLVPASAGAVAPIFEGSGDITIGHPASAFGLNGLLNPGVTVGEYFAACGGEPLSQGVDGWVFLVENIPAGSIATATGSGSLTGGHDLDLWFYDDLCFLISGSSTAAADETAAVPAGTAAVAVTAFDGAEIHVDFKIEAAGGGGGGGGGGGSSIPESMLGDPPRRTYYPESGPNDPYFPSQPLDPTNPDSLDPAVFEPQQWGPQKIQAPEAWQEQRATGARIKVAILDSGLDVEHPDLSCPGKVYYTPAYDVVNDGDGPKDIDGHGTHVAGIIGACTNNATGIAGVAPDVQILPMQVFSSDPDYDGDGNDNNVDDLADAIRLAADEGAHVINMSLSFGLGVPGSGYIGAIHELFPDEDFFGLAEIEAAISYAAEKGVVIVAAAGNDTTVQLCDYPAISKEIICVAATDPRDVRTWYTNGPNKVHAQPEVENLSVVAPGGTGQVFCDVFSSEEIFSLYAREFDTCNEGAGDGAGYQNLSGTSMATPHVVGVAALVYDRIGGDRSAEEAARVIAALTGTAVDLGTPGYDPIYGHGRVDALAAVTSVPAEPYDTTTSFTDDSATSGPAGGGALLEVVVTDEDGYAVADQEVTFALGDQLIEASTDALGVARVTMPLGDTGSYEVSATLQPSLIYDLSTARILFRVD